MITKNDTMKAVYSDDLAQLLKNLELFDEFQAGHLVCKYCGSIISQSNLYAILPTDTISVCCSNPDCVLLLTEEAGK